MSPRPLNAKVIEAGLELADPFEAALPAGATRGKLVVNARLRVRTAPPRGEAVTLTVADEGGTERARASLAAPEPGAWHDLAVKLAGEAAASVRVAPAAGAAIELDCIEVFPAWYSLAIAPGSGV